ncbi:MAG: hypothetical protein IPK82_41235 [Polyangiaceae bacterium]|nr:hypothetical protein [Polyangiaceae bacterium]
MYAFSRRPSGVHKRLRTLFFASVCVQAATVAGCQCKGDLSSPLVQNFESDIRITTWPDKAPGKVSFSDEWHKDGKRSLRIDPGLLAAFSSFSRSDFQGADALRVHIKNLSEKTAPIGFELSDANNSLYDRHRITVAAVPGESTIDIDLTGNLFRGEENRPYRGPTKTPVNLGKVSRIAFENRGDSPIFIDALTLINDPIPTPEGAFAFDFGPENSRVMGHTIGIYPNTLYSSQPPSTPTQPRFGFDGGTPTALRNSMTYPSPLLGDGIAWNDADFVVDLTERVYDGWIAFERGGFWETADEATGYESAALLVNGKEVYRDSFSPSGPHFFFQDVEVTRVADAYEKLVLPSHAASMRFSFQVEPGPTQFSLRVEGQRGSPLRVAGLILAPNTPQGREFVEAHRERQKRAFQRTFVETDLSRRPTGPIPLPKGITVLQQRVGDIAHPGDAPLINPVSKVSLAAIAGHKSYLQFGLYSDAPADLTVNAVVSPNEENVHVAQMYTNVYTVKRPYTGGTAWVETSHYRPMSASSPIHVEPQLSRTIVVELDVAQDPPTEPPSVLLRFSSGGIEVAEVLVDLTIHKVVLPPLPIPVGIFMNALPYPLGTDEAWWEHQDALLAIQGEAGLNTVTGGPDLYYTVTEKGNEYTFSGDNALRYLELAGRRGLNKAVVGYSGFVPSLKHKRPSAKAFAQSLATFEREHNLPIHYVYAYDEPSTDEELAKVKEYLAPFHTEGVHTIGFFAQPGDDTRYKPVIDTTFAPAISGHTKDQLQAWTSGGKHLFLYNRGTSRLSMGVDLFSMIQLGVKGRLEWIGLYSQGFAFNDLDGREPSFGMFVAHSQLGPLPTPRWFALREGLIDARVLLALQTRFGKDAVGRLGFPTTYPADPSKISDEDLEKARSSALDALAATP